MLPAPPPTAEVHCARELRPGGPSLLDALRAVLGRATHTVCYGALEALPELLELGAGGGEGVSEACGGSTGFAAACACFPPYVHSH